MDAEIHELVRVVKDLVFRVDGLLAHYTSIDADYVRMRNTVANHEERLRRLEAEHSLEPDRSAGDSSSALYPAVGRPR